MSADKRLQIYVTKDEYQQLKEWSDETGKSMSELGREAVLEYTDHDRLRRIEDKIDQLGEALSETDGSHTHKGNAQSVPEKARAVARHIYDRYDSPVKAKDVELAIENIADVGDDRSINKYKGQLKKRGLLYEHPSGNVWTNNKQQFVKWVEGAYHDPDLYTVTEPYGMDADEYIELVEELDA